MNRQAGSLKRMLSAIYALAQTRLELISIELAEEKARLLVQIYICLATIVFGMLSFITLTVLIAVAFWESYRWQALMALAGVYFAIAVLCALKARAKTRAAPPLLAATRAEFERDYQTLSESR